LTSTHNNLRVATFPLNNPSWPDHFSYYQHNKCFLSSKICVPVSFAKHEPSQAQSFPRKRESTRQRLIKRLGVIDRGTLAKVNRAIQISLGLIEV